ncbi:hypothetical protein NLI96_g5610 [Meripilus lineatus]|uniref:chitinase n=1 Tax=Meripilus lineatus TaxID=2056292 RepID=A0AAD5V7E7_9APHY|nr:hypothetical protein NLI96_g5610 [Physisporinus lineatus]
MAIRSLLSLSLLLGSVFGALAFDLHRKDNLAVYWGQDGAGTQQPLSFYCADNTIDTIPLAFLYIFRGKGGDPVIDFGNSCADWNDPVFSGTDLAKCPSMAKDIRACQAKGKIITLSLGGATGQVGFSSDSQAIAFADQIWNMFLGGQSFTRPFGNVVLDGVDLDIESGTAAHYAAFVNRIRSHAAGKSKKYYITAAPQCPFPDAYIGDALNQASFDAVYVQFYNNYCGLNHPSDYNFNTWDKWAKTQSANKNIKVYIGAPGDAQAAGEGYVDLETLAQYASDAQAKYSSFGGVMLWDADTAYTNGRFDKGIKTAMRASALKLFPDQASDGSSNTTHVSSATTAKPSSMSDSPHEAEGSSEVQKAPHEILVKEPRGLSRFFKF